MRKIIPVLFILLSFTAASSQVNQFAAIQKGTILEYNIYPPGLSIGYSFIIDSVSASYLSVTWQSESGKAGEFVMHKTSLQNAKNGYWQPPQPGITRTMDDDHLVLIFSAAAWKQLNDEKKTEYDGVIYFLKQPPPVRKLTINDKPVDALYLEGTQGTIIWLLNNAAFPLILKTESNPAGVDVEITGVK